MTIHPISTLIIILTTILINFSTNDGTNQNENEIKYIEGYAFCKCLQNELSKEVLDIVFNDDCSFATYFDAVQIFTDSGDYKIIDSLAIQESIKIKNRKLLDRPCKSTRIMDCMLFSRTNAVTSLYNGKKWPLSE